MSNSTFKPEYVKVMGCFFSCMQCFALLDCIPVVCCVNVPANVLMVCSVFFLNAAAKHLRFLCWIHLILFQLYGATSGFPFSVVLFISSHGLTVSVTR